MNQRQTSPSLPADVVGVIATFLPPTTKAQQPLMLVNHTWLEGVAGQVGMKPPHISWPYAALRLRDPATLKLRPNGTDDDVAALVKELPRVKAIVLDQTKVWPV